MVVLIKQLPFDIRWSWERHPTSL